jgi:CheY-like chemotaxis protein
VIWGRIGTAGNNARGDNRGEQDGVMKTTLEFYNLGQSLWLDNITRDLLEKRNEHTVADTLAKILQLSGFETTVGYSGEQALTFAKTQQFDLLISDVAMEGMNGVEAAIVIRELQPKCRILLRSGHAATAEILKAAIEKGHSFEILAKPFHPLCDTVSDRYPHFLADELLLAVGAQYNVRKDAYSHAIAGFSSGGNCSFNAAWQLPQAFSQVLSGIGSYTSIQRTESPKLQEGAQDYPDKVLREEHRNIRVWLQDGSDDLEQVPFGSWPLGNIRLANALKLRDYDFHFSFGSGGHGPEQVEAQLPDVLTWLWRDYDAGKQDQSFQMESSEKAKPVFRVMISNRGAN